MATARTIRSRYRNISISTFIVLALSFTYYFFVYVNKKETQFNDKAFRIIENVGQNVEKKYNNYSGIVENAMDHLIQYNFDSVQNAGSESLRKLFDSLSVPVELDVISFNVNNKRNNSKTFVSSQKTSLKGDSITIDIKTKLYTIKVRYKINILLENTLRRDFFQEYLLFSNSEVFFSDIPVEKLIEVKLDSIFKKEPGELSNPFHSTDRVELEFENKARMMYVRPVSLSDSTNIYIGGIIEKQYYRQQAYSLGTNTSIVLVVILILLILSLPFVKIYLIDGNERLNTWDVVSGFLVLLLGTGFITLSLLGFFTQKGPSAIDESTFLKTNSSAIEKEMKLELSQILRQMNLNEQVLDTMAVKSQASQFRYDRTLPKPGGDTINKLYKYFQNLMWIDGSGQQLVKWQDRSTARVKLTFRPYFTVPKNKKNILWSDSSISKTDKFYVDAIRSVTEGKTYAVISKVSKLTDSLRFGPKVFSGLKNGKAKAEVVAMVTKLHSLDNLPLPTNLSYMVVNADGLVLFHKNPVKILQENLIDEIDNRKLMLALDNRREVIFLDFYDESDQRFFVKPIGKLPLFLITYIDEGLEKNIGAQIFSLSTLFYLLLFLIVLLQLVLFMVFNHVYKRKTKGSSLFNSWVWPKPSNKNVFTYLSVYMLASMFFFFTGSFYSDILISISFLSLMLTTNLFVLKNYRSWSAFLEDGPFFKMPVYFAGMIILALWIFLKSDIYYLSGRVISVYVIYFILSCLTLLFSFKINPSDEESDVRFIYNSWYSILIFSFSFAAILGFYTKSYNYEKSVYSKYLQLGLFKNMIGNVQVADTAKYDVFKNYVLAYEFGKTLKGKPVQNPNESFLVSKIRINLPKDVVNITFLEEEYPSKKGILDWRETADSLELNFLPGDLEGKGNNNFVIVSKKPTISVSDFIFPTGKFKYYTKYLIFLIVVLFIILYIAVNFWTQKVFLLGIIPKLRSNAKKLAADMPYTYIISPPQSGVITYFHKNYDNIFQIDLRFADFASENLASVPKGTEMVLIVDLHDVNNEALEKKIMIIDSLKKLVRDEKNPLKKIILISIFSPKEIVAAFDEHDKKDKNLVTKYFNILGDFATAYFPLRYNDKDNDHENLPVISKMLDINLEDTDCDKEDKVLNVQDRAQLYYYATWNSMEKREQLLIYDLVTDGLVNYRNLYVIYNLMSRGILTYKDGTLDLFDKSFANFVLTIVDKERSFDYDSDARRTGSWSNLKVPLLMVIGAILLFIFLSQQKLFNDLFGWFTAALALIPVITKILSTFSFFSGGSTKKQ